jgi:hypothetical protein
MALPRCRHCSILLTDDELRAPACPSCGGRLAEAAPVAAVVAEAPPRQGSLPLRLAGGGLLVALAAWLLWSFIPPEPKPEPTPTLQPVEPIAEAPQPREPVVPEPTPVMPEPMPMPLPPMLMPEPPPEPPPLKLTLRVQYQCGDATVTPNQLRFKLNIINDSEDRIPLSELTVRYWYTRDGDQPQMFVCDHANFGNKNVQGTFHTLPRPVLGADGYLTLAFARTGTLSPREETGEIQVRIHRNDWSRFVQTDDYSLNTQATAWTDAPRITLYRNGILVWGVEPAGVKPK